MKKILVIDGNSIINRAYYGVRPLTTKSGKFTNAIFGMINIIWRQMERLKPDYAAVAFDVKHPTFRHEMYEHYKEGRHPTPPELLSQFADAKECLYLLGLKVIELPGWEADDIQGTIAKMSHGVADTESYILSGDRDLLQLIDDKVTVLLATNSDTLPMHRAEFFAKYGIQPEQFVDMKALMGDSSDNIPGVGGVGEKTAATLIQNFGSLEQIYESIDDKCITKGVREKLLRDKDSAFLSQKLARIATNAPIGLTLADLEYNGIDRIGLYKKFTELELNQFITKFKLTAPTESIDADCEDVTFREVSANELAKMPPRVGFDDTHDSDLRISYCGDNLIYHGNVKDIIEHLQGKELICYDGKALWHRLDEAGADMSSIKLIDLQLYEYVINPGSGTSGIRTLAAMFLGSSVSDGCEVALYERLERALRDKISGDGLDKVLDELELPLLPVLANIEKAGFKIDPTQILEFGTALGSLADELAQRIYMQAGEVFNLNSPKQLGEVLFDKMGLGASIKKGKSGYHTDAQTLADMRHESPIIDDILEYRQVTKLKGTYTDALVDAADENGRIHTDFKQALTATGRLSSAEPNLQNIPIKTKMGRELRRFFIAEDGYTLVDADYSQIELRLLAHISGDYTMTESFKSGEDIHRRTAAAVFGVPEEYVTEDMRKRAKAVNFGIVYGIGGYSLAKDIGTSVAEASRYIKSYLMNYPDVDRYLEQVVADAERDGYTTTIMGRRRYIPELKSSKAQMKAFGKRVAMNAPIQGSAADIMKLAMLRAYDTIKAEGLDARIVMQVHDELIVEVRDDQAERCKTILREQMENVLPLNVPLTVDVTSGKNWLEQK